MIGGGDQEVLAQVPWERRRFVQIGGMLLTAAGVAWLSMIFALHDYIQISLLPSIVISLIWAVIFFNIERFLVLSIGSGYNIRRLSFVILPRLLVAILLGLVISIPITLRVFAVDIHGYIKATGAGHVNPGLLDQLQALSKLAAQSTIARVAEAAIFVLVLLLQMSPIIAQLVVNQSPTAYARIAKNRESILIDTAEIRRDESRRIADEQSRARIDIAEDMRRREVELGVRANALVARTLEEILDRALSDWRQRLETAQASGGSSDPGVDAPTIRAFAREGLELVEAVRAGDLASLN